MKTASREEIVAHLDALLADKRFASSPRNAAFLRYVVQQTLEGKADEIKETVIAADVYSRIEDYDPRVDSVVRVEATRVRQKLRAYYENEGKHARVRLQLPAGTYVPRFEVSETEEAVEEPAVPQHRGAFLTRHRLAAWVSLITAGSVVLAVASIVPKTHTPNPEALAAWQEAVALLDQDPHTATVGRGAPPTLNRAMERLEEAVRIDPQFARAWATLAEACDYACPFVGRNAQRDLQRAEFAARRAVALDDRLSVAHQMLGLVLWNLKWNYKEGERSYRKALELDPRNYNAALEYAELLRQTGRSNSARDLIRYTRALLPSLAQLAVKQAEIDLDLGRTDHALSAASEALTLKTNYMRGFFVLGMAQERKGDYAAALRSYERVLAVMPRERRVLPAYGYLLARTGQREKALQAARRLEAMHANVRNCAFQIAVVYAGLGENQTALDWLEQAWRTNQVQLAFAPFDPRFQELRSEPRFQELIRRFSLT